MNVIFALFSFLISQLLEQTYLKHKITPEIVDEFQPQGLLTIEYGKNSQVLFGNTLSVNATQNQPQLEYTPNPLDLNTEFECNKNDLYIVSMTDPDAPSNQNRTFSQYCHWVAKDVKLASNGGSSSAYAQSMLLDFSNASDLISYLGPGPPPRTRKHRYLFLLYKQDPEAKLEAPAGRPRWGTNVTGSGPREWIKEHGGKSELLAVNFFYSQNDIQ